MKSGIFLTIILSFLIGCQSSVRYKAGNKDRYDQPCRNFSDLIEDWIGTPYRYGGNSKSGIDCSGFTSMIYLRCFGKQIPRTSAEQYQQGVRINRSRLRLGDLVFFNNVRGGQIDHVGIYLTDGRFAHASESDGVMISQLDEDYYRQRYYGACRY